MLSDLILYLVHGGVIVLVGVTFYLLGVQRGRSYARKEFIAEYSSLFKKLLQLISTGNMDQALSMLYDLVKVDPEQDEEEPTD